MEITGWMKIEEVLLRYPETFPVFARHGFACLDCSAAEYDNVERGAIVHGIDPEQLVRELNACLVGRG